MSPTKDHTTFGGRIYASDFDRKTTLSEAAAKIIADKKFDQQCKRNSIFRKETGGGSIAR